ncbi:hypothetical protein QE152_g25066 [Popillia japonica]|uniref:Uncharacterized protein n=1 Tax=Popillia japonica TaxID=7064 RepID=A0AAW1K359_POPJA
MISLYYNNIPEFKKNVVTAAIEIFDKFQQPFSSITTKQGPLRAMQKMGMDGSARLISYLLSDGAASEIQDLNRWTPEIIIKGVLRGKSPKHKCRTGRALLVSSNKIRTSDVYENVGVCIIGDDGLGTHWEKRGVIQALGHRTLFVWEDAEMIKSIYKKPQENLGNDHNLTSLNKAVFIENAITCINNQIPTEDVKICIGVAFDKIQRQLMTLEHIVVTQDQRMNEISDHVIEINQKMPDGNPDQPVEMILSTVRQCVLQVSIPHSCASHERPVYHVAVYQTCYVF